MLRDLGEGGVGANAPARVLRPGGKNLRAQVDRLDPPARTSLEQACGLCVEAGHYEVELPHLLLALTQADVPTQTLLSEAGVEPSTVSEKAQRSLDRLPTGCEGRPVLGADTLQLLDAATSAGDRPVTTRQLILTLVAVPELRDLAVAIADDLGQLQVPA